MRHTSCVSYQLLFFFTLLYVSQVFAIGFVLGAGKEQCFYEHLLKGTRVGMTFQVTSGGNLDIDATVSAPDGTVIYAGRREKEGRYFFVAHTKGTFTLCYSNTFSAVTEKRVAVTIEVGEQRTEEEIIDSIKSGRGHSLFLFFFFLIILNIGVQRKQEK